MFQDELPPEVKKLELDEPINNKEQSKDQDYMKYSKKALELCARYDDPEKKYEYIKISKMRIEQFEQEDEKAKLRNQKEG